MRHKPPKRRFWAIQTKRSKGYAHRFRPTYPDFLHGAPPTPACAAFIKESRMKFVNARKLDRKSGVRSGEGHPSDFDGFRPIPMDSVRFPVTRFDAHDEPDWS
jgi:hypothetical protein